MMMPSATQKGEVYLTITDPSGRATKHSLTEENSMLVGSGSNTVIQLRDHEIASVHCLIRFSQGVLAIDDWCSATGTIVNGIRIEGETELHEGDTVSLGSYTIDFSFTNREVSADSTRASTTVAKPPQDDDHDIAVSSEHRPDESVSSIADESQEMPAPEPSPFNSSAVETLPPDTPEEDSSWDSWFSDETPSTANAGQNEPVSLEEETIQLLNLEVTSLHAELETQANYIAELESRVQPDSVNEVVSGDADLLEERLQDLLAELQRTDQRTATLEDLLHLSDDATEAEKQERQQIESWVADIESRISGREAEWQAEKEELQKYIDQLQSDRDRMEESLNAEDSSGNIEAQERAIEELRETCAELEQKLAKSEDRCVELESQLETADMQTMIERQQQVVEEAVREEQLAMARERAEFSRSKAELLRRVSELESDLTDHKRPVSDADARFNAFRDHLREIKEKPRPAQQAVPLTKRLVSLWNRLEYGPTDTE